MKFYNGQRVTFTADRLRALRQATAHILNARHALRRAG